MAPGTGGLRYDEIEGFGTNDLGQTAFWAKFEALAGHGLFLANPGQTPELVVREGGSFEVSPGDVRVVTSLQVVLESASFLRQHERGGFNDAGELTVGLGFGAEGAGVYAVTVPKPHPTLLALGALLAVGSTAGSRSRQRRRCPAGRAPAPQAAAARRTRNASRIRNTPKTTA